MMVLCHFLLLFENKMEIAQHAVITNDKFILKFVHKIIREIEVIMLLTLKAYFCIVCQNLILSNHEISIFEFQYTDDFSERVANLK